MYTYIYVYTHTYIYTCAHTFIQAMSILMKRVQEVEKSSQQLEHKIFIAGESSQWLSRDGLYICIQYISKILWIEAFTWHSTLLRCPFLGACLRVRITGTERQVKTSSQICTFIAKCLQMNIFMFLIFTFLNHQGIHGTWSIKGINQQIKNGQHELFGRSCASSPGHSEKDSKEPCTSAQGASLWFTTVLWQKKGHVLRQKRHVL